MGKKKTPVKACSVRVTLESASDALHNIRSAINDARLDGSVEEVEALLSDTMILARDATQCALMLTSSVESAKMRAEIALRSRG